MLVSLKEIGKYVDLSDLTPEIIAQRLTFSGIEVEQIKKMSDATNLVIGEVLSYLPHPNSDHLHCCKVNVGDEILDIVCGAPNVREGLKVIVALPGAKLPKGEIKKGEIRGVESNGMLCALNELGVDPKFLRPEQIAGIEELPSDAPVGSKEVLSYLGLDDVILDLNLLANRSDCFALFNVAREIAALFKKETKIPEYNDEGNFVSDFKVGSETPNCPSFFAKVIKGIEVKDSPKWLKEVLRSEGIRSIDNIVDIGNYVMLLTGQPMHMYDYDKLAKKELIVKESFDEDVVALDDKTYHIIPGDLIVASGDRAACIGGVMGLKEVEVDKNTKNIVLEVANFNHASIRHTTSRLGLMSDSSQRYIKEINPHQSDFVINLAAHLIKELSGYKEESKTIKYDTIDHKVKKIACSCEYINKRLGSNFDEYTILSTLSALNFGLLSKDDDKFVVEVPPYRIDVEGKADLSEEVVRYNGFDSVKSSLPYMETTVGGLKDSERKERIVEDFLLSNGFDEVLTYVLINQKDDDKFNYFNKGDGYVIKNPLTEDHKYVRKNLLTSVLRCAEYNINHQNDNFKIFEISPIQTKKVNEVHLAAVLVGQIYQQDKMFGVPVNYFFVKGLWDSLIKMFNIAPSRVKIERLSEGEEFHPNRSAKVYIDNKLAAVFGDLHPLVKKEFSLDKTFATAIEINLSVLFNTRTPNNKFVYISKYPVVSRDYAFIIKNEISYFDIKKEIKKCSNLIKDLEVFDIYKGDKIADGHRSIALKIKLNSDDHTLKEDEINAVDNKVREVIKTKLNAELRQ